MPTKAFVTIEDYTGEKTTCRFWVQDVSALNYDSVTQDIDEVKDAILGVIRGEVRQVGFTKTFPESSVAVADKEAQREEKWMVMYRDTTQFLDAANTIANPGYLKLFSLEVGTADLQKLDATAKDMADLTDAEVAQLVTDFEANIRSPYNNSAQAPTVEVVKIVHVGRNT